MKKAILLIFAFIVCALQAQTPIQQVHRHIIVLYDLSGSSGNQFQPHDRKMRREVNDILIQLLTSSELKISQNARIDRDVMDHFKLYLPLYHREKNDRLDFLTHGINGQDIQLCESKAKSSPDFIVSLSNTVFRHSQEAKNADEIPDILKGIQSLPEYDFQMIRYVYPFSLAYLSDKRISADTVIVIQVSDFVSGDGGIGLNDRLAVRDNSRNKVDYIENEVVKFFNNNFLLEPVYEIVIQRPIYPANPMLVKVSVLRLLDVPVIEIERKSLSLDQEQSVFKMNPFSFSMYVSEKNRQKPVNPDNIQKKVISFHLRNKGTEANYDIDFRPVQGHPNMYSISPFDISSSIFRGEDLSVGLVLKFDMVYNPNSYWKGTFYYSVQSAERDAILNFEPPPGMPWWIWAIIIAGILLFLYLVVFFLYKPSVSLEIIHSNQDLQKIVGFPEKIPAYEWDEETEYRIEFDIHNRCNRIFPKKISGCFRLRHNTTGNQFKDELFRTGMYISKGDNIYGLSDDPSFTNIAPGEKTTIELYFRPGAINEPEGMPIKREDCFELEITANAPGTKNVEECKFFRFTLTPKLNTKWLAIDPGTTGTCVAYGQPSEKISPVKMEGSSEIMPTTIYFKKDGNPLFGQTAVEQISASPENGFFSIKKLIGYQNARTVILKGEPRSFTGEQITELLISHLYDKSKEVLKETKIDKLVVAVPNYYTPVKIRKVMDIIKRVGSKNGKPQIHKVLHIYEAEAVALYFIKKYRKEFIYDNEDILIFDFGGGTINVSIVNVRKENGQTRIEIEGRVGYAIGGDTIDRIVAEYLYEHIPEIQDGYKKHFGGYGPFALNVDLESKILKDWRTANVHLKKQAKELKEKLSIVKKGDIQQDIAITLAENKEIKGTYTFHSSEIEEYILNFRLGDFNLKEVIQNSINEVLDIFNVVGDGSLETAILSGRSSQLPFVEKLVVSSLQKRGQNPQYHPFTGNETKTCVAEGAVYYGSLHLTEVRLSRPVTLANYGLKIIKNSRPAYESIITINRTYQNDMVIGEATKINIIENGGVVPLYQINGANPADAITNDLRYKTSILLNLNLRHATNIERIKMILTDKDTYDLEVRGAVNLHLKEQEATSIDLFEDNLDLALWPFDKKAYNYKPTDQ